MSPENEECSNACGDVSFIVPDDMAHINKVEIVSNAAPGGSILYIARGSCSDPDSSICEQSPLGALISKPLLSIPGDDREDREGDDEDNASDWKLFELQYTGGGASSVSLSFAGGNYLNG